MDRPSHGISPDGDDFASRYDRMVQRSPLRSFLITAAAIVGLLVVIAVIRLLIGV